MNNKHLKMKLTYKKKKTKSKNGTEAESFGYLLKRLKFSRVYSHKYMKSTKQTYFIHSTVQIYMFKWKPYSCNSTQSYQCIYIWASLTAQSANMYIWIKRIYKLKRNNTDVCSLKIKSSTYDKYLFFNVICFPCQCTSFNDQNWS